jgi:hypothetical protein
LHSKKRALRRSAEIKRPRIPSALRDLHVSVHALRKNSFKAKSVLSSARIIANTTPYRNPILALKEKTCQT